MRAFADLLDGLIYTRSRNAKLRLIGDYLRTTPDPDRGWAMAALTGTLDIPAVKPALIRALIAERVDPVLFGLSRDFVGDTGILVHTSPRLIGRDPVEHLLRHVTCNLPGSIIRAAESDLGRIHVAEQLEALKKKGCDVRVFALADARLKQPGKKVKRSLGDSLVLTDGETRHGQNSIHTKMMLISAALDNSTERSLIVLTGSQNLDKYSLRTNDECQMEIHDGAVYSQYLGYWYKMMEDANAAGLAAFEKELTSQ